MSEFFGDGSRFIGSVGPLAPTSSCSLHAQRPDALGPFRLDGESHYVQRGVHVAIMDSAAVRARPDSHAKRHLDDPMAAAMTGLAGRCPAVHDDRFAPVPPGLVLHLPPELAHAHVGDGASEVAPEAGCPAARFRGRRRLFDRSAMLRIHTHRLSVSG